HRSDHAHPALSTPAQWWAAVYGRYVALLETIGLPGVADATAFAELRSDILTAGRYQVFDDVVPALTRAARGGWRSLIVSNHVPELESLVSDLGLTPFSDSIVGSDGIGYDKPHPLL